MRKPIQFLIFFFTIMFPLSVYAQDIQEEIRNEENYQTRYNLGDQSLSINAGAFLPLFFAGGESTKKTNLTVGGCGSLHWNAYLNNSITVGIEGGGMFAFSPNRRTLFMLPIKVSGSYYVFRKYPFEIPLSLRAGITFNRLGDLFHIDPIVKPGLSFYWAYNTNWSFGLNLYYWWVPQIYVGDLSEYTRFGNFLEISLSALYHFE